MKNICVITGGGSGMGLEAAKIMGEDHYIIISGRTKEKLNNAVVELKSLGVEVEAIACDVSNKDDVENLGKYASELGNIKSVIHAAGISPNMSNFESILRINTIGTINVNNVFYKYMKEGSCIIDVSSMAGHMLPKMIIPIKTYKLSRIDTENFIKKLLKRVKLSPEKYRTGLAYSLSKNFVTWFAKTDTERFARKGVRVVSVSPGIFDTPMGNVEEELNSSFYEKTALRRSGKVEEIAYLFRCVLDERMSYLTGTDILCDGGFIASKLDK